MVRIGVGTLVVLSMIACEPIGARQLQLDHRSQLLGATRGVELTEDGDEGHAGMLSSTCDIETKGGQTGQDYNFYRTDIETVRDVTKTPCGNRKVLVTSDYGLHTVEQVTWGPEDKSTVYMPGIDNALLIEEGTVIVRQPEPGEAEPIEREEPSGCQVEWHWNEGGTDTVPLNRSECGFGDGFTVVPDHGIVVIGDDDGGWIIHPDNDMTELEQSGDIIDYDDSTGLIYVSSVGADIVYGVTPFGTVEWAYPLPDGGEITDVTATGGKGVATVMVAGEVKGEIVFLDGQTGEVMNTTLTPQPASQLTVSDNGKVLGAVTDEAVYFFDIRESDQLGEAVETAEDLGLEVPELGDLGDIAGELGDP